MDMLTDSGVNAMSDNMQSAMLRADDAYAGSETFYRMRDKLEDSSRYLTGRKNWQMPISQNSVIISKTFYIISSSSPLFLLH